MGFNSGFKGLKYNSFVEQEGMASLCRQAERTAHR